MSTPASIGSTLRFASPSTIQHPVERFVDQPIGVTVLGPADVADRPRIEIPKGTLYLFVQSLHPDILDLVAPFDLPHDELRVADQLQLLGAMGFRQLDPAQQRSVLGDVVGRLADPLPHLVEHPAVTVAKDDADGGGTRVAAGAPVDVDHDPAHRFEACSPARMSLPSPSTSAFHCRAAASS